MVTRWTVRVSSVLQWPVKPLVCFRFITTRMATYNWSARSRSRNQSPSLWVVLQVSSSSSYSYFCVWFMFDNAPPCSTVVHFLPRQSLLFDVAPHSSQPSSLRSYALSGNSSQSYFNYNSLYSFSKCNFAHSTNKIHWSNRILVVMLKDRWKTIHGTSNNNVVNCTAQTNVCNTTPIMYTWKQPLHSLAWKNNKANSFFAFIIILSKVKFMTIGN